MSKLTYLILFVFLSTIELFPCNAQDSYYDARWNKITQKDSATYLREVVKDGDQFKVTEYYLPSKAIYSTGRYLDKKLKKKVGKFEHYFENGNLKKMAFYNNEGKLEGNLKSYYFDKTLDADENYSKGQLHGDCKWYHKNGQLASKEVYDNGKITQIEFWDENGKQFYAKFGDEYVAPEFGGQPNGAQRFLYSKIKFPEAARYLSESGRTLLNFTIEEDGSVGNVTVELSADAILDDESLRVARLMPKWKPGKAHNRIVRTENVMVEIFYKLMMSNLERY